VNDGRRRRWVLRGYVSIRFKVMTLLSFLFVALGLLELTIQRQVLLPSFSALERDDARISMRRVGFALEETLQRLQISATDWGNWADTWHFAQQKDPGFVEMNMTRLALRQLNVNAILIVDPSGHVLTYSARDLSSGQELPFDLVHDDRLPADFPWLHDMPTSRGVSGLIRTSLGVMMAAAAPILDGQGNGPSRGMVILCRVLGEPEIGLIGAQAQAAVARVDRVAGPPPTGHSTAVDLVETRETTQVFQTLTDIRGRPVMTLRVDVPRRISEQGRAVVSYASVYFGAAAVGVLVLLLFLLNRLVLGPLAAMTRHAVAIGHGDAFDSRLDLPPSGEIGRLAAEFDRMLDRLKAARQELVDRAYQSGFAELARGVLHNLGNAMTPLGVRLSSLEDRLRRIPAQDLAQASAELSDVATDAQRREGLIRFLQLGCREVVRTLESAREDLGVLKRQSAVVQTTLSEQLRSSRTGHVAEPVSLPDLIGQSLEIVPDDCRTRLAVESDVTLQRVGPVRVARTVLRLILQNLIINAADAVRAAGRESGRLLVTAEILREQDRDQLHLVCQDDGVGIAQENLQRVFERGFSTKPAETNHGLGLHWCANAVASLGGRIWAASEGVGLGASLHVAIPVNGTTGGGT